MTLTVAPAPTSTKPPSATQTMVLTASPTSMTFQAVQGAADPPNQTIVLSKTDIIAHQLDRDG